MAQRAIVDYFSVRKRPGNNSDQPNAKKRRAQLLDGEPLQQREPQRGKPAVGETSCAQTLQMPKPSDPDKVLVPAFKKYEHLVDNEVKLNARERKVLKTVKKSIPNPVLQHQPKDVISGGRRRELDTPTWWQTEDVTDGSERQRQRQALMGKKSVQPKKVKEHKSDNEVLAVPAYEKYQHLVADGLQLPQHYKVLAEKFHCVDTVVSLMKRRRQACSFDSLKSGVEQMCRRSFEKKNLGQMKTVYPTAYTFQQEKGLPYFHVGNEDKVEYQLTVDIRLSNVEGNESSVSNSRDITSSVLVARRKIFRQGLVDTVKHHHQDFLISQGINVQAKEVRRWHPKFDLSRVPDIADSALPEPPVKKGYMTAGDVLEDAREKLAPKVVGALETVSKRSKEGCSQSTKTDVDQSATGIPVKSEARSGLEGLVERIKAKEVQRIKNALTRDPATEQKLALLSRLPEVCCVLRSAFVDEKKAALPWDMAIQKLHDSCTTPISTVSAGEHLKMLAEVVPSWITIIDIRQSKYVKLDRKASLSDIIDKIKKEEAAVIAGDP